MGTQVCSWLHCRWKSFRHFCGYCEERRQRHSRPHRYHHPSSFGTQACLQDPQAFQLDQGRQRVPVRDQEAPSSKGGQETSIQSSQDHCRILVLIPLVIVFQVRRLVTPIMLQRKRQRLAVKRKRAEKNRQAAAEYAKILAQRQKEAKEAKEMRRKRSASLRESRNSVKSS